MNILGTKLRNSSNLGMKLKSAQTLGKKLLSDAASSAIQGAKRAEVLLNQGGNAIDIGARKIGNTAGVVDRSLGRLNPYLQGSPLESISTGIRDLAKGTQVISNEARQGGRDLIKLSQRGLAKKVEDEVKQFV